MNNKFTAQELSEFFKQVADGGEIEFRDTSGWRPAPGGPAIGSSIIEWRIKPKKKVIDLSVLIDSNIDCEFTDDLDFYLPVKRIYRPNIKRYCRLIEGLRKEDGTANFFKCEFYKFWPYCRPRMNHIHAWMGGKCPIEGFVVRAWFDKEDFVTVNTSSKSINWSNIMYVEFLEVEHGYFMPWEQDNE